MIIYHFDKRHCWNLFSTRSLGQLVALHHVRSVFNGLLVWSWEGSRLIDSTRLKMFNCTFWSMLLTAVISNFPVAILKLPWNLMYNVRLFIFVFWVPPAPSSLCLSSCSTATSTLTISRLLRFWRLMTVGLCWRPPGRYINEWFTKKLFGLQPFRILAPLTSHDSYEGSKGEGKFCLTLGGFRGTLETLCYTCCTWWIWYKWSWCFWTANMPFASIYSCRECTSELWSFHFSLIETAIV